MSKIKYAHWLKEVHATLKSVGQNFLDIADFFTKEYYEHGYSPREAAILCLEDQGADPKYIEALAA